MATDHRVTRRAVMRNGLSLTLAGHGTVAPADDVLSFPDPLSIAIQAYRDGIVAFEAIKEDDWSDHGGEEAVVERTYGAPLHVLQRWELPALTRDGAIEALRFAEEENRRRLGDPIIAAILAAALAYFEGGTSRARHHRFARVAQSEGDSA